MSEDLYNASERAELLSQAIRQCEELRDTLARIGPSRFARSADSLFSDTLKQVVHMHELEDILHERIQDVIEKRNIVLSPVSRLPDDILRLIFVEAHQRWLEEHTYFQEYRLPSFTAGHDQEVGSHLSQTSRRWRAVALDTANLWNGALFHNPKFPPEEEATESLEAVHPWYLDRHIYGRGSLSALARSKTVPLTVEVALGSRPALPRVIDEYQTRICPSRVVQLILGVHTLNSTVLESLERCISSSQSTLRSLHIAFPEREQPRDECVAACSTVLKVLFALEFPRLLTLELKQVLFPLTLDTMPPGLLRCRSLQIDLAEEFDWSNPTPPAGLLSLLDRTPLLEELHIVVRGPLERIPRQDLVLLSKTVALPHLRLMHIGLHEPQRGLLFGSLVAPNLEVLAMELYHRIAPDEWPLNWTTLGDVVGLLQAAPGQAPDAGHTSTIRKLHQGKPSWRQRAVTAVPSLPPGSHPPLSAAGCGRDIMPASRQSGYRGACRLWERSGRWRGQGSPPPLPRRQRHSD